MPASVVHPKSRLLALANELHEHVIANIERPQHLLNLAKTCRLFYSLVVPNHLYFRDIRCCISRDDIWKSLAEKPLLAANVRCLGLFDHEIEDERIPKNFTPLPRVGKDTDYSSEEIMENITLFLSALRRMHNLSSFSIWTGYLEQESRSLEPIFNVLNETHSNNSATQLSNVYISAGDTVISELLQTAYWPQLRRFGIHGSNCVIPEDFLRRHSAKLESLWVLSSNISKFVGLPRLHSLNVPTFRGFDFSLYPNIKHFSHNSVSDDLVAWLDSRTAILSLESCQLPFHFATTDIALFLKRAPNLKKLAVSLPPSHDDSIQQGIKVLDELLPHLARLKLTHLCCLSSISSLDVMTPGCPPIVRILATAIPSLAYLDVLHSGKARLAYIERDDEGAYLGLAILISRIIFSEKWLTVSGETLIMVR